MKLGHLLDLLLDAGFDLSGDSPDMEREVFIGDGNGSKIHVEMAELDTDRNLVIRLKPDYLIDLKPVLVGRGQGLAEYALILALIAVVAVVALQFLGSRISTILSTVGRAV